MKSIVYVLALGLSVFSSAQAQRVYYSTEAATGKKDIVSVVIPEGWVQTDKSQSGVHANQVLVKDGESEGMIFIQTIPVDESCKTVEAVIAREKIMFDTKSIDVKDAMPITVEKKGVQAQIIKVIGSADGNQVIAFIPIKNAVIAITLCSTDSDFINRHTADFESLVQSYQLNPIINPPSFADLVID
jgi:hypothetical protein